MKFVHSVLNLGRAALLASLLGACALAPGMHFDDSKADGDDAFAANLVLTEITPDLVLQQRATRVRAATDDYNALAASPQPYRIGKADVLSIIVWDHPELVVPNLTYTLGDSGSALPTGPGLASQSVPGFVVDDNGNIQFPYVGNFKAAGRTTAELQKRLADALVPYIRKPQLTVSVVGYRSQRVFIEGQVAQAGIKPITNVPMSLPEALGAANGIPAGVGDTSHVELLRKGKRYRLNLPAMAADGFDTSRILLQDRDIVRVSPQSYNQVFVVGEVSKPTPLPMHDGSLTLSDALASAGSVNPLSAEASAIYVVRATQDPSRPEVYRLNSASPVGFALAEHFDLKPKDVVYVDASGLARWSRMINLLVPTAVGANATRAATH
jgi:polysaccharide biosynthesis/export protein